MIKAVIFDMYEMLITLYGSPVYFGTQIALDAGIAEDKFQKPWNAEEDRAIGKITLEEILEKILKENGCYSESKMNYYKIRDGFYDCTLYGIIRNEWEQTY